MFKQLIRRLRPVQVPTIRSPAEEDKPRLVEIFNAARQSAGCFKWVPIGLAEFNRQTKGEAIHIAEIGGQIAGFVSIWEKEGFIHHLYICPRFQGRGLGPALLRMCELQYGLPLSLKCICANERALGFYRRHGWVSKRCGTGPDGPWEQLWLKSVRRN